ncbi:MAG: hypothetical protein JNK05_28150 [Myxococcales bacterium]|nr:hypothetical protein [Myxococcales bacterium]
MNRARRLVLVPAVAAALAACGPTADFDASVDVRDVTSPRDVSDVTMANDAMDVAANDAANDAASDADATSAPDVTDASAPMDATDAASADATDATSAPDAADSGAMDVRDVVDTGVDTGADTRADSGVDTGVDTGVDSGADTGSDARSDSGVDTGVVVPPTVDGVIAANEYGVHAEGQNQRTEASTSVTWFMRSTDSGLYVAVTGANLAEGAVLYVGASASGDAGSPMDGTLQGFSTYDNTRLDPLPFRASFVVYFKNGYQEARRWNGADAWGPAVTTGWTYASNPTGSVREILIPWSSIRTAGRPASFAFTGYVTSPGGFAYGEMPPENPGGSIGTSAVFPYFYRVSDSSPIGGTPPFSARVP